MRKPSSERAMISVLIVGLSLTLLPACRNHASVSASTALSPTAGTHKPSLRAASTPTIQSDPTFREAERLYRARDFTGAEQIVDRLLATPDISTANPDFLLRQKTILHRGARAPAGIHHQSTIDHQPLGDCGPRALAIACAMLGVKTDAARLTKLAGTTDRGTSLEGLANAARAVGLKAQGVQVNRLAYSDIKTPAVIWLNGGHFAVLLSVTDKIARIHDPNNPRKEAVSADELFKRSGGILLKLSRK